jgi:hypothetical protein
MNRLSHDMSRGDSNASDAVDVGGISIVVGLRNQPAGQPYDMDRDGEITVVDITRTARWWVWSVPYSLVSLGV